MGYQKNLRVCARCLKRVLVKNARVVQLAKKSYYHPKCHEERIALGLYTGPGKSVLRLGPLPL